jgi:CheY-like chemotaxis protein
MSPGQRAKLFQPFVQAEASTTRRFGGSGLGLALSLRLCQMMGGSIEVQSQVGLGSTFEVRIPASIGAEPAAAPPAMPAPCRAPAPAPAPETSAPSVLLIDDDPAVRDLVTRALGKRDFRVTTAASGEQGLAAARSARPAVILLDVMLPGMDGWAVLAELKADPALAEIPVVMLTFLEARRTGFALGARDFLVKPVDPERLAAVVGRHAAPAPSPVLVVDDDPGLREVVRRKLTKHGWTVQEACNGREALEKVAAQTPSLILLDLMMPEMDGFELLDELRAHEAGRTIPVVVVTAKDLTEQDRERLSLRVGRVVQKGALAPESLLEIVRQAAKRGA